MLSLSLRGGSSSNTNRMRSVTSTLARRCRMAPRQGRPTAVAAASLGSIRRLNVHEYISMELFQKYGIPTPKFKVAFTPEEAEDVYMNHINTPGDDGNNHKLHDAVIKAQVLSSGRRDGYFRQTGFQGGIHYVTKPGEARELASQMLGHEFVRPDTDVTPQGIVCHSVVVMERLYLRREMYLSLFMDRASQGPLLVACPHASWMINKQHTIAHANPELVYTERIDVAEGLQDDQRHRMALQLGLEPEQNPRGFDQAVRLMKNLYAMFTSCDCTHIELHPLAETPEGDIVVCDARVNFDDNAQFRQAAIFNQRDSSQQDPREVEAADFGLTYIGMGGNIGCMVNGAGLAMSTMDLIQLKGGTPANFLDVGGGANETQVQKAFEILNGDPSVKAILVNIFGGIMRCDVIATGIINAARTIGIRKPIVVRLQGTNVTEGKLLIEGCGFKMILADDLEDAAEKAVGIAEIAAQAEKIHVGIKFDGLDL